MTGSKDNLYRDAVEKLRILLQASEEANYGESDAVEDDESEIGKMNLELNSSLSEELSMDERQLSTPRKKNGEFNHLTGSSGADRRIRHRKHGGKIKSSRNLFEDNLTRNRKYSSWHNLVGLQMDEESNESNLQSLLKKQEIYINQIEKENRFCRERLSKTIDCVKEILENRSDTREESFQFLIESLKQDKLFESRTHPVDNSLKIENINLRKKVEAMLESGRVNEQALKQEVTSLSESLNRLRSELDEVSRRESEAVEQVKRSVDVAEQVRLEKTDLEFEIGQLKVQVERQQTRIRTLIEEQVVKSEEERSLAEKRYQSQLNQLREEFESQAGDTSRIQSENEKLRRTEVELRKNLVDRDSLIQDLRSENDKRIVDLQMEVVTSETRRQKSEQELALLKLDLESLKHEIKSEKSRAESEARSLKTRLSRTEEILTASREENLKTSERNASLERELNLTKLSLEQNNRDKNSNVLLESYVKECDSERRTHRMIVEKLEDLVRRQSRIIGELKNQCGELSDKLETISKDKFSVTADRDEIRSRLLELERKNTNLIREVEFVRSEIKSLREELAQKNLELKELKVERTCILRDKKALSKDEIKLVRGAKVDKKSYYLQHKPSQALATSAITINKKVEASSSIKDCSSRK